MSLPEKSLLPQIKELEEKICEGSTCNLDKLKELHQKMCAKLSRRRSVEQINTSTRPNLERLQHLHTVLASKEDPSL